MILYLNPPPKRGRLSPRGEGLNISEYLKVPPSLLGEGGQGEEAIKSTELFSTIIFQFINLIFFILICSDDSFNQFMSDNISLIEFDY